MTLAAPAASHPVSVLGLVSYACTVAAIRLAKDADKSPDMGTRAELLDMSVRYVRALGEVDTASGELGLDARAASEPYRGVLGDFDERLRPLDWAERLVKTSLALGLLDDFCRGLVQVMDDADDRLRSGLSAVLGDPAVSDFAARQLLEGIGADPQLAARLGLWSRRVVGEEIGTLQRLLSSYPALLMGRARPEDLHQALGAGATDRMRGLGLSA